jgi:hypothetical protein
MTLSDRERPRARSQDDRSEAGPESQRSHCDSVPQRDISVVRRQTCSKDQPKDHRTEHRHRKIDDSHPSDPTSHRVARTEPGHTSFRCAVRRSCRCISPSPGFRRINYFFEMVRFVVLLHGHTLFGIFNSHPRPIGARSSINKGLSSSTVAPQASQRTRLGSEPCCPARTMSGASTVLW